MSLLARGSARRAVLLTGVSNLALPLSAVLTGPVLARALGPEGRGELAAVLAPVALVALLATVGLPEACTYLVATRRWTARRAARVGAVTALLVGVLAAVGLAVLAPVLLRQSPDQVPLLWSLCPLVPIFLAGSALRGTFQGVLDFGTIVTERWVSVLSRLGLVTVFAVFGWLTVTSAAWVTNGTALAALGVLVWRTQRLPLRTASEQGEPPPDGRGRSDLLRYGSRVWVGSLSVLLILRLDQVLMAPLTAAAQLGFYAVAVALAEIPSAVSSAVRDVVFSTSATRDDPAVAARACRTVLVVLGGLAVVMVVSTPLAVRLLFGVDFAPAAPMAQIMIAAAVPSGLAAVAGAGLFAMGRPGTLSIAQAAVAVVNTVLVLLLVPAGGGMGAALASLVAYVLLAAVTTSLFVRTSALPLRAVLVPRSGDVRGLLPSRRRAAG